MNNAIDTEHSAVGEPAPTDITLRVLGDLMNETMMLMDETVALGDQRTASGEAGPHEIAIGLRLAARLARVGGWLMAHSPAETAADPDEARAARLTASLELHAAARGKLDGADQHGPVRMLSARIDRLVARACRLDALFHPGNDDAAAPRRQRPGSSVLAFPLSKPHETAGV